MHRGQFHPTTHTNYACRVHAKVIHLCKAFSLTHIKLHPFKLQVLNYTVIVLIYHHVKYYDQCLLFHESPLPLILN